MSSTQFVTRARWTRRAVWTVYPLLVGWTLWGARGGVGWLTCLTVGLQMFIWYLLDKSTARSLWRGEVQLALESLNPGHDPDLFEYVAWQITEGAPMPILHRIRTWLRAHDIAQTPTEQWPVEVRFAADAALRIAAAMSRLQVEELERGCDQE